MTLTDNLYKHHAHLIRSVGGKDNFNSYIFSQPNYYVDYLLPLANHSGPTTIVSPWKLAVNLLDSQQSGSQQIITSEPYRVFTIQGELLYTVSNHFGYFGSSSLDVALISQSKLLDFYYLEYQTSTTPSMVLLVVNKFMPLSSQQQINKEVKDNLTSSSNQVTFKLITANVNTSLVGNPIAPINIYMLEGYPSSIPTPLSIKDNPLSTVISYDLEETGQTVIPQFSGWVVIHQTIVGVDYFLRLIPTNTGYLRLIEAAPNLYYLALPEDLSMSKLQSLFNTTDLYSPVADPDSLSIVASITI